MHIRLGSYQCVWPNAGRRLDLGEGPSTKDIIEIDKTETKISSSRKPLHHHLLGSDAAISVLHWIPYGGDRRRGRPATRWEDSLEAYAREYGFKWEFLAEDRGVWSAWEGGYVQRAMIRQEARQPDVDSGKFSAECWMPG